MSSKKFKVKHGKVDTKIERLINNLKKFCTWFTYFHFCPLHIIQWRELIPKIYSHGVNWENPFGEARNSGENKFDKEYTYGILTRGIKSGRL